MSKYKGLNVYACVDRECITASCDVEEIEASLCGAIFKYLEAFGCIPPPYVIADTHGERDMSSVYVNFKDMDGEPWAIKYVSVDAEDIIFYMVYGA